MGNCLILDDQKENSTQKQITPLSFDVLFVRFQTKTFFILKFLFAIDNFLKF